MNPFSEIPDFDLLAKYFAGEASPVEAVQVEHWRDQDPRHKEEYEGLQRLWSDAGKVLTPAPPVFDADKAWQKVQGRISSQNSTDTTRKIFLRWLPRVAAFIAIALVFSFILERFMRKETAEMQVLASSEPASEHILPDQSIITLRSNSEIVYDKKNYNVNDRSLSFNGEAYFKISPDKQKPFVVDMNGIAVRVLGTEFNIDARQDSDSVLVSVNSGNVLMADAAGDWLTLEAGKEGIYYRSTGELRKRDIRDANVMAWKSKTLIFERTEISQVVTVLEEVYQQKIEVRKERINKHRITATFNDEPLDSVIAIIAETFSLKVTHENNRIIIDE